MNRAAAAAVAMGVAMATAVGGYALDAGMARADRPAPAPGTVTVDLDIHHSRFSPERIRVAPGTLVRFVVHNRDPINHELIVGDDDVHARHTRGTEAVHPPVPGELSVGPGETGVTALRFAEPGRVLFACHLPGHFEYGMKGEVVVTGPA